MGKQLRLSGFVLLTIGAITIPAHSATKDIEEKIGPFFGVRASVFQPDSSRYTVANDTAYPFRSEFANPGLGLQYGLVFTNQWQLRTYFDRVRLKVTEGQNNVWGHTYGVDALYRFASGIYMGAGLNNTRTNMQRDPMLRGTLGFQFELLDRFYTTVEYNVQTESDFTDQQLNWSLNYRLGRDMATQTLPREFRARQRARASQQHTHPASVAKTAPQAQRQYEHHPAGVEPAQKTATDDIETLREPPAELPFGFNAASLDNTWYGAVGRIADILSERPSLSLVLIGHTDLTGEENYNLRLSQQRADYVAQLLIEDFNIAPARIKSTGLGMDDPLVNAISPEANAKNRRVEVLFQTSDSNSLQSADQAANHRTQG